MMTPYEKLKSLPDAERFLKPGVSCAQLDAHARAISDNEAAQRLNDGPLNYARIDSTVPKSRVYYHS